ncbi:YdeI family protein [Cellulomonas sp. P24]|uniref:YdeI/OmpD-associated family protein n=1 Tax=Cellulomonas sp. P24 TaxID=2885206 RepID=UPI00216ACFE0|nr:YdeI/OmpD-associated family protein [Cellulomonas sp. P24]MCR6492886.1 YdeI/OmpD-associated family protein [Cellulomonas sp. P24]
MRVDNPGTDDLPGLLLPDVAAWREWLVEHHPTAPGVWLVLTKKGGAATLLTYEGALLEALCVGWIDGQGRARDDATSFQRFTPRRARSPWSASNVARADRLTQDGRMLPAGLAQVAAAKADGRWDRAYGGAASMEPPEDLLAALAEQPRAQAWWDVLTSANRFAICYRLQEATRPETRARRLERYVADLAEGRTLHPQKRRPPAT